MAYPKTRRAGFHGLCPWVSTDPGFQILVHLRLGKGGVTPEEQTHPLALITFHRRRKDFLPTVGAVDIARPQHCPFAVPEVVEQEEWMVTH